MNKKILLVDDANLFLEVAKQALKPTGAQILTARSGVEALKVLEATRPDVIILDLMMPEMGGDKVCMAVKSHPRFSDIPVIMVTSRGRAEEFERCQRAGCDDFLTKPIKPEVLLEKILRLNKRSRRHAIQILVRMEVQTDRGKEVSFGTTNDLSTTGISIRTGQNCEKGQDVTVRFFIATNREELVLPGSIVRKESQGAEFSYGIHFGDMTAIQKQTLTAFIDLKTGRTR